MSRLSSQPRILIADDQEDVLEALRLLLKPEGFDIDSAATPQDILEALKRKDYESILMDLNYTRDTTARKALICSTVSRRWTAPCR